MMISFVAFFISAFATNVIQLTPDNFASTVQEHNTLFVKFYAPWCGHCKALAPAWEELATQDNGELKIAEIDLAMFSNVGANFGIKGFPTLKLFKEGTVYDHSGSRAKDDLLAWYTSGTYMTATKSEVTEKSFLFPAVTTTTTTTPVVVKRPIIQLNDTNFESLTQAGSGATTGTWFVKFFSERCGHCKAMAPAWQALANSVDPSVTDLNVAQVDVAEGAAMAKRFNIKGYPTLILFKNGKYYEYEGQRTADALSKFYSEEKYLKAKSQGSVPRPPAGALAMLIQDMQSYAQLLGQTVIQFGVKNIYPDETVISVGVISIFVGLAVFCVLFISSGPSKVSTPSKKKSNKKAD